MIAEQADEGEKCRAGDALDHAAASRLLNAEHHVAIALRETPVELTEQFGLLLEIAVDQKHQIAGGLRQPGHQRLVVAEIAREVDHHDPRVRLVQRHRAREAVVGRAVVHHHQLDIARDRLGRRDRAAIKRVDGRRRAIEGGDDGQFHRNIP